jgi:predicted TIM-barrel fold metal-dependent hydrolase
MNGFRTINAHEHIQDYGVIAKFLHAMDNCQIEKSLLVGSSRFTITLNPAHGFTRYDENNQEIIKSLRRHPGRFEAWPTLHPLDRHKLSKIKQFIDQGATGVKLYLGHGFVNPSTRRYLFHPIAMNDQRMYEIYKFCEKHHVPLLYHVNPGPKTAGFCREFVDVLTSFPDLKVNCPHLMLSSIRDSRLQELLDTFPNLFTDLSFGHDDHLIAALKRVSREPDKFTKLFSKNSNRIMFGTDLVVTRHPRKTTKWCEQRIRAYYSMLSKDIYTTALVPNRQLYGLALPKPVLERLLHRTYTHFRRLQPTNTKIRRRLRWERMGVKS